MEAQQCVKLTGTNRSIGLIPDLASRTAVNPAPKARRETKQNPQQLKTRPPKDTSNKTHPIDPDTPRGRPPRTAQIPRRAQTGRALERPGGYGGGDTPDPIPNSAVKPSSADGTASTDAGE